MDGILQWMLLFFLFNVSSSETNTTALTGSTVANTITAGYNLTSADLEAETKISNNETTMTATTVPTSTVANTITADTDRAETSEAICSRRINIILWTVGAGCGGVALLLTIATTIICCRSRHSQYTAEVGTEKREFVDGKRETRTEDQSIPETGQQVGSSRHVAVENPQAGIELYATVSKPEKKDKIEPPPAAKIEIASQSSDALYSTVTIANGSEKETVRYHKEAVGNALYESVRGGGWD